MRRLSLPIVLASLLTLAPAAAEAALARVGPVNAFGYPQWYQDASGLTMDFCSPTTAPELTGGWCLMLPPIPPATLPVAPEVYPNQFFNEHFYWAANATVPTGATRAAATALLTLSVEAAFASGPVIPGTQITFGRMRIFFPSVPVSGDYTIYHPFGSWFFPGLVAGQRLFFTEDVGFNCAPGVFDCALATPIGPYLLPSATQGGAEIPPIPLLAFNSGVDPYFATVAPLPAGVAQPFAAGTPTPYPGALGVPKYIADPARLGPVTGSPLAPFISAVDGLAHNHNTFRIEVKAVGAAAPVLLDESPYFTLQGRVFEGTIPGIVSPTRASYTIPVWAASTAAKLDVFATGIPGTTARVPAAPAPLPGAAPALVYWDAPCALDPVTLAPIGPPPTPVGGVAPVAHQMVSTGSNYWGQSAPPLPPPTVCISQTNAVGGGGVVTPIYFSKATTDEVRVSQALYDPITTAYSLAAASSDSIGLGVPPVLPTLTLFDFGPFTAGVFNSTNLPAPATAHVTSSEGGFADFQTTTALAAGVPVNPVAVNDMITMFEDCSALPATSCATPQVIAPLANDTYAAAPIVFGPGVTVRVTALPRIGAVSFIDAVTLLPVACTAAPCTINSADGSLQYTPNANANGTDGFAYTVTVTDAAGVAHTSSIAGISVVITPVNDPPVAVNDTVAGFTTGPITVAVLANDTDPDGIADIVGVSNLSAVTPAGATAALDATGRNVIVTATLPGTYTFTYQARDTAGALSALPATATVNVAGAETLTVVPPALFRVTQSRWTISGTDTPPAAQVITLKYANGPNVGFVLGTATVDPLGNWLFDIKGVTGLSNPTVAQATAVSATGPTGVTVTVPISIK